MRADAWADIGASLDERTVSAERGEQPHAIVRKFAESFSAAGEPIGTPIGEVQERRRRGRQPDHPLASQIVLRIRQQDFRGAVVYDSEIGTVWLCRVARLADFAKEQHAYEHLAGLWESGQLLPDPDERIAVGLEIYWSRFIEALEDAKRRAEASPHQWQEGIAKLPGGGEFRVGSAYYEEDDLGDGRYIRRFFLIVKRDPAELRRPDDWLATATAILFEDEDELVDQWAFAHEIPGGRGVDEDRELALRQFSMRAN